MSKSSFFHHFRDLDDLCLACFERCKALTDPGLRAADCATAEALLMGFGEGTAGRTTSRRFLRILMFFGQRSMNDPRFRKIQVDLTESYQSAVASLVLEIEPRLDRDRVLEAVGFLLIVIQGIATHRVLFEDQARMSRIWPHAVDAAREIMAGRRTRGAGGGRGVPRSEHPRPSR